MEKAGLSCLRDFARCLVMRVSTWEAALALGFFTLPQLGAIVEHGHTRQKDLVPVTQIWAVLKLDSNSGPCFQGTQEARRVQSMFHRLCLFCK